MHTRSQPLPHPSPTRPFPTSHPPTPSPAPAAATSYPSPSESPMIPEVEGEEHWREEWNEVTTSSISNGERGKEAGLGISMGIEEYPNSQQVPEPTYYPQQPSSTYYTPSYHPISAPPSTTSYTHHNQFQPYYPPQPQPQDRIFSSQSIIEHPSEPEPEFEEGEEEMVTVWAPVMMSRKEWEMAQREEVEDKTFEYQETEVAYGYNQGEGEYGQVEIPHPLAHHIQPQSQPPPSKTQTPHYAPAPQPYVEPSPQQIQYSHQQHYVEPNPPTPQHQQIHPPPPTPEYYNTHLQHHQGHFPPPATPQPSYPHPSSHHHDHALPPPQTQHEHDHALHQTETDDKSDSLSPWETASHNMAPEPESSMTSWSNWDEGSGASWATIPGASVTSWASAPPTEYRTPTKSNASGKVGTARSTKRATPYPSSASLPSFSVPPSLPLHTDKPHLLPTSSALPPRPDKTKSHARKASINHIPRPRNSFILFRSHAISNELIPKELKDHKSISKIVGELWKSLNEEERRVWEVLADEEKRIHKVEYPGYVYKPKQLKGGPRKRPGAMLNPMGGSGVGEVKEEEGEEMEMGLEGNTKKGKAKKKVVGIKEPSREVEMAMHLAPLPPLPPLPSPPEKKAKVEEWRDDILVGDETPYVPIAPELHRSQTYSQPPLSTPPSQKKRSSIHQRPKLSPSHSSPSSIGGTPSPFKHSRLARRGSYTVGSGVGASPGGESQSSSNASPQPQRMEGSPVLVSGKEKKAAFATLGVGGGGGGGSPFIQKEFDNSALLAGGERNMSRGMREMRRGSLRDVSTREMMAQVEEEEWVGKGAEQDRKPTFALETKDFLEKAGIVPEEIEEERLPPPPQPHFPTSSRNPTPPTTFSAHSDELFTFDKPQQDQLFTSGDLFAPPPPVRVATRTTRTSKGSNESNQETSIGNGSFESEPDLDGF